jgi:hypothetical protein
MDNSTLDSVLDYQSRGWCPIPVPAGKKEPVIKGWQNMRLSREDLPIHFSNGTNVGLLNGSPSSNIADTDLDWPEARAIAPTFLPQTHRISGRSGAPLSHYWYTVEPLAKTKKFEDPLAKATKSGRAMIVEFRSTGTQTIVPPSRHPSGELYEWHEEGEPTKVSSDLLLARIAMVAACSLTVRYWPNGCRHDAALALAGGLLRAGWTVIDTELFIVTAATVAGDDQVEDRRLTVSYTAERLNKHGQVTGWPRLSELIPEQIVTCLIKWLDIKSPSIRSANFTDPNSIVIDDWPDPEPLPNNLLPVPAMQPALLPEPFAPWLLDIAERMQCPLDYPAVGSLVALASVVGNQIAIRPKRHDDWSVVPNLFGAIVGRPGVLKSPSLEQALKPLHRLRIEAREAYEQAASGWQIDRLIVEAKKDKLKDEIKKATRNSEEMDREQLRRQQAELESLTEPSERRYIINDSTVEKVGELLNQNPRGLLLFRDELTGWLRSLDREGHESDRAFYLEAWAGTEDFTYDRIGRGTLRIKRVTLSILGSIQPGPLTSYLRYTMSGGQGDDGLLQRFQLMVYPDVSGDWRNVDRFPDTVHKNRAFEIFKKLNVIDALQTGAFICEEEGQIAYLRFNEEGQAFFDSWRADLERTTRSGQLEHPALEAHISKYRSLMPSLALLFHLIDRVDGKTDSAAVSLDAATKAAAWCTYLFEHAKRIYGLAANATANQARTITEKIRSGALKDRFTAREVYRNQWTGLTSAKEVAEPLTLLEDFGWLRSIPVKSNVEGGRPTVYYFVNPKVKEGR